MPKLYQHQLDDTYYTRLYWPNVNAIVTRQIHPDGVVFLKRQGVQLEGEIPAWLIDELDERNWLATKEEMPFWGIVNWPKWHLIDAPKPKPFPKENPFITKKREAARAAKRAAEAENRRIAEETERQKIEAKREANRESQRRYRARKKAEVEAARIEAERSEREAERKREAARERRRRWAQKKNEEAQVASAESSASHKEAGSTPGTSPHIETLPHTSTSPAPIGHHKPRFTSGSLTQLAPRKPRAQSNASERVQVAADPQSARGSIRLFALLLIGFILLVMAVGQVFDFLPL